MRRTLTFLLIAVLTAGSSALAQGSAAPSPALSLAAAVNEALVKNERVVNQSDAIAQADLGLRLARNTFRPKVTPNIFGSLGRDDISSQTYRVDVSQKLVTGTELRASVGTVSQIIPSPLEGDVLFYNADTTFTVSQPLLRGFGRSVARRGLSAAELRREDAARLQLLSEQQVAVDVAAAYYRVVSQQAFVDVARQSLGRARRLRDASEAKLDAGLVSQLDVLRSQQLVSQAEMQLFDSQSAVEDARDQLTFLMGRDKTEPFTVEAIVPRPGLDPIDVTSATAIALANRLDLKSRIAASDDAENQIRFSRNQLLPQVDVNFALTRRETAPGFRESFGLDGYKFATFFTIAMPVDRTTQQVEYQSAMIDRERRRREAETLERQIVDNVKQIVRERERLIRNVAAAENGVDLSRREVDVAQLRYENGLSNNLDVVTAEAGLLQAESRRIQALADSAVAGLRLRAVLGVFNPRTDMSGSTNVLSIASNLAK
ncbi:MAG TPA: TolC family protein [Vicinamibacterales bacterium]|nr:TolC family protein [Vicinamibacterales bacterium]